MILKRPRIRLVWGLTTSFPPSPLNLKSITRYVKWNNLLTMRKVRKHIMGCFCI